MALRFVLATFLFLLLVGWLSVSWLALRAAHRRIARFEAARPGSTGMWGAITPMLYAVSIVYWPLSFFVGAWLLRTPSLARQGRISLLWGFSVVAALLLGALLALLFRPL